MKTEDQYGLGVRILGEEPKVELLFELPDAAQDEETGELEPAALKIALHLKDRSLIKSVEHYEGVARDMVASGTAFAEPGKLIPITWEKYLEYEDDE